ncbi:MAG: phage tail protein [Bacteroidales bacterium]|nr:phage tail protein [Bacteroidales bacterium]
MSYIRGQYFIAYAGGTAESNRVAFSRSCSVEVKMGTIEVSSPDTGTWKSYIAGKGEWAVSVSGLVADSRNDLVLFRLLKERTLMKLYYRDVDSGAYFYGDAILTQLTQNAEVRQVTTYSAKFQGSGELLSLDE